MCNTSFFMGFCLKIHYGIILVIQGHLRVRKVIYKIQNKIAARYFKVKYDFSTNEARNKCNTSFSCDFDWAIRFLYYFYDSRSSSMSKSPFQGQISKNTSFNNNARNMCNISFSLDFVSKIYLWYYFGDPRSSSRSKGHFQGRKQNGRRYFKVKYDLSTNEARNKCNTSFLCDFDWAIRLLYYFYDSRSSSRSKPLFQGQISKITIFNK